MARLINASEMSKKIPFGRSTILNWAYGRKPAPDGFPEPVKVTNRLFWIESEVDEWIESLSISRKRQDIRTIEPPPRGRGRPRKSLLVEV